MLDSTQIFDGSLPNTGAAITVTRTSTNVLNMLVARETDEFLGLHVRVIDAFVGGTSLQVGLDVSADNTTFYSILLSPVVPAAQLIAGAPIFRYPVPVNQVLNATAGVLKLPGQYYRLSYTVVGTFTAGSVLSFMNPRMDRNVFYAPAKNYTVNVVAAEL